MRTHNSPVTYRRPGTGRPTGRNPFVLAGQKDFYDLNSPADHAEYRIVQSYNAR